MSQAPYFDIKHDPLDYADIPTNSLPSLFRYHVNSLTSYNGILSSQLRTHRLTAMNIITELYIRDAIHLVSNSKAYARFIALEYAYHDNH